MIVGSRLPHAECGPNDYRKDAPPFTKKGREIRDWLLKLEIVHGGFVMVFNGFFIESFQRIIREITGEFFTIYKAINPKEIVIT